MTCERCGQTIYTENVSFCPYCGYYLNGSVVQNVVVQEKKVEKKFNYRAFLCVIIALLWCSAIVLTFVVTREYFFIDEVEENEDISDKYSSKNSVVAGSGETAIVYDNKYYNQSLKSISDVYSLIRKDSLNQKSKCPNENANIEKYVIENYGIVAINFCEMSVELATETRDLIGYVYNTYPSARNYLTNITIANVGKKNSYIAAFMPIFIFVTSPTVSTYPVGIKTQIILNAEYFLNESRFENSVKYSAKTGFYPKNATKVSTLAHEFGHYLSYVAMMKYYNANNLTFVRASDANTLYSVYDDFNLGNFSKKIIEEAHGIYLSSYNYISFDNFRESISTYAVTKDEEGKYIYDETIAEAFHDCYLNRGNAAIASQLIVEVLERYL